MNLIENMLINFRKYIRGIIGKDIAPGPETKLSTGTGIIISIWFLTIEAVAGTAMKYN